MTTSTNRARAAVAATTAPPAPGTEVAEATFQPRATVAAFIERMRPEIAGALPRHMDVDRVMRLAMTVVRQSEIQARKSGGKSLSECTPDSFAGALLTASALGLEPGINGEAYLVPYKGECTLIIGYQGYAKLFWQHPLAKHLDAHAVHERDAFDYGYGLAQFLRHKPAKGDRGRITDYYAVAELSTGASSFVVLSAAEVRELRGGLEGPTGKIPDPQHWMERKTALRQLVKLLPKSANLATALAVDERSGSELRDVPEQIDPTTVVAGPAVRNDYPSPSDADQPPANVNTETGEITDPGDGTPDQSFFDELNAGQ